MTNIFSSNSYAKTVNAMVVKSPWIRADKAQNMALILYCIAVILQLTMLKQQNNECWTHTDLHVGAGKDWSKFSAFCEIMRNRIMV